MNTATSHDVLAGLITPGQRRALFAIARQRGMTIDDLRGMTPQGSISAITRRQAARLLSHLNAGTDYEHPRPKMRPRRRQLKGVYRFASEAQHRKIEALRIQLAWAEDKLQAWLAERHHPDGRPMTRIDSTSDGVSVIELLKGVLARSSRTDNGDEPTPSDGGV